jgi:pimeloyl-ACP methyl ester carboxylesterase
MKKIKTLLIGLAVLLIAVSLGLYVYYLIKNVETKTLGEQDRKGITGNFIQLTDGITHYEIAESDTAKTIVLAHGFSVPGYIWGATFDSLAKSGFKVIRYDYFGRGFSDRPNVTYNPKFYRRQLFELISKLNLKKPISLAGLSFGGAVVSDFAAHYPNLIDKVIFVDPVYRFTNITTPEVLVNYRMATDPDKQANGQLADFKYPEQFPNWVNDYKVQMQYKGFRHAIISTLTNYPIDSIFANYDRLNSYRKKVLLIWGRDDKTVTFNYSDSLRRRLQCDFLAVDDAGHLPHLEKPALVTRKMISFLRE